MFNTNSPSQSGSMAIKRRFGKGVGGPMNIEEQRMNKHLLK